MFLKICISKAKIDKQEEISYDNAKLDESEF